MSPTSYQAAPPRVIDITLLAALLQIARLHGFTARLVPEIPSNLAR
jgi:hypothetical protein